MARLPAQITGRGEVAALLAAATNYEEKRPRDASRKALDLGRVRALLADLGDPQFGPRTVHVAGSKGKGTVARMVAAALRAAGRGPVGLYTSPHLEDLTERIEIDARPVSEPALAAAADAVLPHVRARRGAPDAPTFFEIFTAIAWVAFRDAGCSDVVLETGLGGRLDATTVCAPSVCVVTAIEREHTEWLGETIPAIAAEKAGIIKPGVPVVSVADEPARAVIRDRAEALEAPLYEPSGRPLPADLPLPGPHHAPNARAALGALELLGVPEEIALAAIGGVRLPGVLEPLGGDPLVVIDGAHTPMSAAATRAATALRWPGRPVVLVFALLADKDAPAIARALAADVAAVVTTRVDSPRSMAPADLAAVVESTLGVPVVAVDDLAGALARARRQAGPGGLVLCAGSVYLAGAVRRSLRGEAS